MTVTENPFLAGNYGPVPEERTIADLPVTGAIPTELNGRYLRIGPNPHVLPVGPYHWFLGDGMVHGIELAGGEARSYRNRWVRTDEIALAMGEQPVEGPKPQIYDSSNTHVIRHAGRILALTEGSMPYELSPELETLRRTDFGGPLTGFTAHPKIDPVTGEMLAMAYWFAEPYLTYHVIDVSGKLVRSEPITIPASVMMHDFAITREHVLFFDFPVVFDLNQQPFPFRWDDDHGARVGVMPREGGDADVRWFDVEPCYVYHPMNAYDDGDTVIVDVPRHATTMKTSALGPNDGTPPTLERWTIDLAAGKVREERLDDRGQEFPRVNETLLGSRHRYGYAVGAQAASDAADAAGYFKHDFGAGTSEVHDFGPGRMPGELVFVPGEGATSEDDGWLMGYVYDQAVDRSELVILDAHDFGAEPVARVHLPVRVPFGFHGSWLPDPR